MGRRGFKGATVLLAAALMVPFLGSSATAAPVEFKYLEDDGVPEASMSEEEPPDIPLPNHDPGRDDDPGLLLSEGGQGGNESDPDKYQQWEYDASGLEMKSASVVIYAAMKDFSPDETGKLKVFLRDCAATCTTIASVKKTLTNGTDWKKMTFSFDTPHVFEPGHTLVVKMIAPDGSEDDLWLAYGTWWFDAYVQIHPQSGGGAGTSTTTTTVPVTTTTTPTTTTTLPPTTTTTLPPTTTSTLPPTTTTLPSTTTSSGTATGTTYDSVPPDDDIQTDGNPVTAEFTPTTTVEGVDPSSTAASTTPDSDTEGSLGLIASSDPGAGPPTELQSAQVLETSEESEMLAADIPDLRATLTPQDGLLVGFATMAQSFGSHLLPFLGLVLLGGLLILAGLSNAGEDEASSEETVEHQPGSWWFSG